MIPIHAMCRLTCFRCWRTLIWQCQHLHELPVNEISVLVPCDGRSLAAAQQLAKELSLPVRFIASANALPIMLHQLAYGEVQPHLC